METKLDDFAAAYIECALWASSDDSGEPMDGYSINDIAPETMKQMVSDCERFQADNAKLLEAWYDQCGETPERAGHDFWLTRNGHGAGFWDRWSSGTPQGQVGRKLTEVARVYGGCDLYVGDDEKVYGQ